MAGDLLGHPPVEGDLLRRRWGGVLTAEGSQLHEKVKFQRIGSVEMAKMHENVLWTI